MLTLDNFETRISSVILERAKSYFKTGQVVSLEEKGNNTWLAEVEGSEIYSIEVMLENDRSIHDYFCNCPYDDSICKHAGAVFFALREEVNKKKNNLKELRKKDVFENLLQSISLAEYQDFMRAQALKNKSFKTEFELFFADKDNRIDVEEKYKEIVNKLIKKHTDRGFINYGASLALSREIDKLVAAGLAYISKQNFKDGFAVVKAILKPVMLAVTECDDSSGSVGNSIDNAIALLENIANSDAALDMKEQLFQLLQMELNDKKYFDYGDFGYNMFSIFQSLAVELNDRDAFMRFVDARIANGADNYDDYRKQYFQKRKINFLQATGKTGEAETLISQSMDIVEVRMEQVNKAIEKNDFNTAKKLIWEGIKIAEKKDHPGTGDEWQRTLLQIAFMQKDVATIRHYTKYFAFDGRALSADYYKQWKATYSQEEWTSVIEDQIEETKQKVIKEWNKQKFWKPAQPDFLYSLAPFYIQEKMWDRLLILVQQERNLDTILQYHGYLVNQFPEALLSIYLPALETFGMKADKRSEYADLVRKMKLIIKDIPTGKEKIIALAKQLKDRFSLKPRRPAMIEELNKILG